MIGRKHLFWFAGVVALVAAAVWYFGVRSQADGAGQPSVRTATVQRGSIEVRVSGTGALAPAAQASLSFAVSGNVGEVNVDVGQQVKEGEVLLALDPASLDPSLLSAEVELLQAQQQLEELQDEDNLDAQLAQARKELAQARDALEDAEYLYRVRQQGNRASPETIDAAEARLVLAQHEVDQAKAAYDQLSGRPSDDPARALALRRLANARQERDAALRSLNWYKGGPTEIQQAELEADVAIAEARLAQAEERVATLEQGPDPDELATARARLRAAEARVEQFRLTAPFAGTVLALNYDAGDSVTPGAAAVVIADLGRMHVTAPIDELDIAAVQVGQPVTIALDALPELALQGRVAEIDLFPAQGTGATEYPVRVDLTSSDARVRVGMTAAVNILVEAKENAVLIPNWSLRFDRENGGVFVMVRTPAGPIRREISLGLRNESLSEVTEGLQAGEEVLGTSPGDQDDALPGPFGGG